MLKAMLCGLAALAALTVAVPLHHAHTVGTKTGPIVVSNVSESRTFYLGSLSPVCNGTCNVCAACCKPYLDPASCASCVKSECNKPPPPPPPPSSWVPLLKLSLQNYALAKADSVPTGFVCTKVGKKHKSCSCWGTVGKPRQHSNDCDSPNGCLMYSDPSEGGSFQFADHPITDDKLVATLNSWAVPGELQKEFQMAALTSSADFKTFDFKVAGHTGKFTAHVGSLRKDPTSNLLYLGYTFGTVTGKLITPEVRHVKHGDCHGTDRDQKERGFTSEEIAKINAGLQAYAFKTAASKCG